MGYLRTFSLAIASSLMTPVVVSSVPAMMLSRTSFLLPCAIETRSAPSSIVTIGFVFKTDSIWL